MIRRPKKYTATIANGATVSDAFLVGDYVVAGIITPAALTGTAITFQVSDLVGGTYVPLYDSDGVQVTVAAQASRGFGLSGGEADAFAGFPYAKLVSNAAEGAARSIIVLMK